MVPDQQRLSPEERANLVAYLDGELNDAESRSIATKLTQSMTARREVEFLQKTWEMLDLLPRPKASEDFASRTLTFAGDSVPPKRLIPAAAARAVGRAARVLTLALLSALLFAAGYLLIVRVWPNPSARLARDLSIAESLDEYRAVGGIDYLKQLDTAPEFN